MKNRQVKKSKKTKKWKKWLWHISNLKLVIYCFCWDCNFFVRLLQLPCNQDIILTFLVEGFYLLWCFSQQGGRINNRGKNNCRFITNLGTKQNRKIKLHHPIPPLAMKWYYCQAQSKLKLKLAASSALLRLALFTINPVTDQPTPTQPTKISLLSIVFGATIFRCQTDEVDHHIFIFHGSTGYVNIFLLEFNWFVASWILNK